MLGPGGKNHTIKRKKCINKNSAWGRHNPYGGQSDRKRGFFREHVEEYNYTD